MYQWLVMAVNKDIPHRVYPPEDTEIGFSPEQAEEGKNEDRKDHPPKYSLIGYRIQAETPEGAVSEAMRRITLHIRSPNCPQEWITRFQAARQADMFHVQIVGSERGSIPELHWTVFQGSDGFTAWDRVDLFESLKSHTDELTDIINQVNNQSELPNESTPNIEALPTDNTTTENDTHKNE